MKPVARAIALLVFSLAGCEATRDIVTAPTRLFGGHRESSTQGLAANSDVVNPGHPLVSPTPKPQTPRSSTGRPQSATSQVAATKGNRAKGSPSPQGASAGAQFPVAKPVPGKSGLVFNPFNPHGAYIDISGYAPGSKVKDPDSQKIFVVP